MIGQEIGSYVLEKKLGEGGMGEVYLGRHRSLGTSAAVKVMSPAFSHDQRLRDRFTREARTQAQLRHPNVAQVLDHVEADGRWFLIVEYMANGTLEDALQRSPKPLPIPQALAWAKQALRGLNFAHSKGIIHRDVKPANLLLNDHGELAVTDFGIAMEVGGRRLTQTGSSIGTPEYMSPEQIRGAADIDHRTDLYSMGVVLYELLAGRVPFESSSTYEVQRAQVSEPPPPLRAVNPEVPPALEAIVMKALAKAPSDRYSSCGELADALEAYERGEAQPIAAAPRRSKTVLETPEAQAAAMAVAPMAPVGVSPLPGAPVQRSRTVAVSTGEGHLLPPPPPPPPAPSGRRPGSMAVLGIAALIAAIGLAYLWYWYRTRESVEGSAETAAAEAKSAETAADRADLSAADAETSFQVAKAAAARHECSTATDAARDARTAAAEARNEADLASAAASKAEEAATKAVEEDKKKSARDSLDAAQKSATAARVSADAAVTAARRAADAAGKAEAVAASCGPPPPKKPNPDAIAQEQEIGKETRAEAERREELERKRREDLERKQREELERKADVPPNPTLAVLAVGDPVLVASLEPVLEDRLLRGGFDVQDEHNSLKVSSLLDREGTNVDMADLMPLLVQEGFHVAVLVKVEVGIERRAEHRRQEMSIKGARLRMNAYLLPTGKAIGRGWTENVEYTELSAKAKGAQAFIKPTVELVNAIREAWTAVRAGK